MLPAISPACSGFLASFTPPPFPRPPGVNLGFNHAEIGIILFLQLFCCFYSICGVVNHDPFLDLDTV
jgi:hypothetical protein